MESNENNNVRGALIVFEGLDRSDRNTCVGQMISSYLANKSQLDDQTVHQLFSANRWEKRSLMESKLKSGTNLIVDRYSYSGVAFSSAKGLDIEWCKAPERGLLAPDLVVYLNISPEIIDACLPVEAVEKQLKELGLDCITTTCRKGKVLSSLWLR
ncbi:hypothetical protein Syun_024429 [Stephania yunnanensis]|uniref:dTMP kinase n=1 Tax=Stephania yunnanensis TaxID=152371 RepID=A0AAP0I4E6_9MAGN